MTIIESSVSLLLGLLIALSCAGLGRRILGWFQISFASPLETALISFGLGVGILSHIGLLMGLAGLYRKAPVFLLLIGLGLIGLPAARFAINRPNLVSLTWWHKIVLATGLLGAVSGVIGSLAPPYAIDTLNYHLTVPKFFMKAGGISFQPSIYFNFPLGGETLYTLGRIAYRDTVGLVINAVFGLASAMCLYAFGGRHSAEHRGALAAGFFLTLPIVPWHAIIGKPDLGLVFYTLMGFFLLHEWFQEWNPSRLLLSGVFGGFAASWKYTGLYTVAALVLMFLVMAIRKGTTSRSLTAWTLTLGGAMLIAGLPWYLKNWILAGNPIWPMFPAFLGGKGVKGLVHTLDYAPLGRNAWTFLAGPLLILLHNRVFGIPLIGPLFGSLLPLFPLAKVRSPVHRWIFLFGATFYAIWFSLGQDGRYLLPVLTLMVLPLADVMAKLEAERGLVRIVVLAATLTWCVASAGVTLFQIGQFLPVTVGWETKEKFMKRAVTLYDDILWINTNLPGDAVIFSEFEGVYYLERAYVSGSYYNQGLVDYSAIGGPEELWQRLKNLGITHVFVRDESASYPTTPTRNNPKVHYGWLLARLQRDYCETVYRNPQGNVVGSMIKGTTSKKPLQVCRLH